MALANEFFLALMTFRWRIPLTQLSRLSFLRKNRNPISFAPMQLVFFGSKLIPYAKNKGG
jgi:hypothetical protein